MVKHQKSPKFRGMMASNINEIGNDMLVEIFDYFDSFEQNYLRAVCMTWKNTLEATFLSHKTQYGHYITIPLLEDPPNYFSFSKILYTARLRRHLDLVYFNAIDIVKCIIMSECLGHPRIKDIIKVPSTIIAQYGAKAVKELIMIWEPDRQMRIFILMLRKGFVTYHIVAKIVKRAIGNNVLEIGCMSLIEIMLRSGFLANLDGVMSYVNANIKPIIETHGNKCVKHIANFALINNAWDETYYNDFMTLYSHIDMLDIPKFEPPAKYQKNHIHANIVDEVWIARLFGDGAL